MDNNQNQQSCSNCFGFGRDGKIICITCNGSGYVKTIPLGMQCEYGNCKRMGKDYNRPKEMQIKGWENEPIHLCLLHAFELKVNQTI